MTQAVSFKIEIVECVVSKEQNSPCCRLIDFQQPNCMLVHCYMHHLRLSWSLKLVNKLPTPSNWKKSKTCESNRASRWTSCTKVVNVPVWTNRSNSWSVWATIGPRAGVPSNVCYVRQTNTWCVRNAAIRTYDSMPWSRFAWITSRTRSRWYLDLSFHILALHKKKVRKFGSKPQLFHDW